jgi:hypothetical protein
MNLRPIRHLAAAAALAGLGLPSFAQAKDYTFVIYSPGLKAAPAASSPSYTYATLNPRDMAANMSLSTDDLTATSSLGSGVRGTLSKSSGKWYFEMTISALACGYPPLVGIAGASNSLTTGWNSNSEYTYWGWSGGATGELIWLGNSRTTYGVPNAVGDVIGVAVDLDNRQVTFYHNGTSMGTAYTSSTVSAGTYFPFVSDPYGCTNSTTETLNFGQKPFAYAAPSGYNSGWYQ